VVSTWPRLSTTLSFDETRCERGELNPHALSGTGS